jgi:hypothetical protein
VPTQSREGYAVSENTINDNNTSWSLLRGELLKRTKEPAAHASFVIYFLSAVVLIGAGGVWLELYSFLVLAETVNSPTSSVSGLRTAVITFFPALAGSSCMQLIWAEDKNKSLRSFAVFALILMAILAIAISPSAISSKTVFSVGSLASLLALWTWWIANAKQPDLLDGNLDAPLGKDAQSEPSGDLNGFIV